MKKSTIMFDMDGTLVPFVSEDFLKLYFAGLTKKLAPLGYEPKPLSMTFGQEPRRW